MIEAIRPDVLVKGADYRLDEVVGGDVVKGYGGRILLAEIKNGYSTTSTIERMAK
jgi:D-beta-D-heptose 7-phosphate kinase/D-beta-D-heptose 1-phosphate adenosyltransferase